MNEDLKLLLGEEEPKTSADPLTTIVAPLFRSVKLIAVVGFTGSFLGVSMGVVQPNEYMSTGKLLVKSGARESATPESTITDGSASDSYTRDAVNNEVHLLHDPEVFRKTVLAVGPAKVLTPYQPVIPSASQASLPSRLMHQAQDWWFSGGAGGGHGIDDCDKCVRDATRHLMNGIEIHAEPFSSIIGVSYSTHSPVLAQEVVAAFLDASDEHHRNTFAFDTSVAFLSEQVDTALADSMDSDNELTSFRISCGVYDIAEQRDNLITVQHALEQGLVTDQNRLTELDTIISFLSQELEDTPRFVEHTDTGGLRPEVAAGTRETRSNPRWERLQRNLDDAKLEKQTLSETKVHKEGQLSEVQDQLVKLEQCEPQHRLLEIDSTRKRDRATRFLEAYERAELLSLLDQVEMSNLRVLQAATFPIEKIGPLRTKLAMMGMILGTALGIGLAFGKSILDKRLRNVAGAESATSSRVLAIVPESSDVLFDRRDVPEGNLSSVYSKQFPWMKKAS